MVDPRRTTEAPDTRQTEHLVLLGRLAAAVSHELRNPLNAILLHAEILEEDLHQTALDEENQRRLGESVAHIKTEALRMHELVQDYLALARLASLRREPVDLEALVRDCAQEMQEPLASRGITLTCLGLARLGRVALHANTMRRALRNLMQNALEAMPEDGTLTLRGRRTALHVRLAVSDTGLGISEDQLPLLFEPLYTTKPDGTGLGLYLVQKIVTAHDGSIEVRSTPGQGTTFTIALPLTTAGSPQHARRSEAETESSNAAKDGLIQPETAAQ